MIFSLTLAEQIIKFSSGKEKNSPNMSGFTAVSKVPVFGDKSVPVEGRR